MTSKLADDQLVSQKWTSTTFRWYISHRCHIHCVYHSVWYFTLQCRRSPLSQQVNVLLLLLLSTSWYCEYGGTNFVTRVELMVTAKLTGPVLLYGQFSAITESHKQLRLIRQLTWQWQTPRCQLDQAYRILIQLELYRQSRTGYIKCVTRRAS